MTCGELCQWDNNTPIGNTERGKLDNGEERSVDKYVYSSFHLCEACPFQCFPFSVLLLFSHKSPQAMYCHLRSNTHLSWSSYIPGHLFGSNVGFTKYLEDILKFRGPPEPPQHKKRFTCQAPGPCAIGISRQPFIKLVQKMFICSTNSGHV